MMATCMGMGELRKNLSLLGVQLLRPFKSYKKSLCKRFWNGGDFQFKILWKCYMIPRKLSFKRGEFLMATQSFTKLQEKQFNLEPLTLNKVLQSSSDWSELNLWSIFHLGKLELVERRMIRNFLVRILIVLRLILRGKRGRKRPRVSNPHPIGAMFNNIRV